MTTLNRRISASPDDVLIAIEEAARKKFRKASVTRSGNTVTVETKVLWQTQTTTLTVNGTTLEATGDNAEATGRAVKLLDEIDALLDDQGWADTIERLGTSSVKPRAIRNQVLNSLYPDEDIVAATQGLQFKKTAIVVATNARILLLEQSTMGFSSGSRTISLDKVSSISVNKKMLLAELVITTSNEDINVEKVANNEADAFATAVRHIMDNPTSVETKASPASNMDDLERLADLHAKGVLTDEEFAAAKKKALGL